ncbi:gamma-secretase subunit PEN-2-like [Pocillopora verrucosa]|uniref:gamma-secretase subunit PEN-2-like n=1 Tax=Pocillopora damicornis TaxID=46731 RepID=UPI000F54FA2E|nr:gamma-secretase subunit PEN-2-like [Pocillopora damicornis]XP_058966044.1 gamma-secretase subunit PEN-2-like [Pocillopora verrucosa]
MDLRKVPDEEKVNLCRKYFLGGFALLPFLWFINVVWFFREAFIKPTFTGQSKLKSYVIKSAVGFLIWFAGLTAWIIIYQKYRASWGEFGDKISFVIPLGEP